jgi:hypothetical protein
MERYNRTRHDFIPDAALLMQTITARGLDSYFTNTNVEINYNNKSLQHLALQLLKIYKKGWKDRGEFICK